MALTPAQFKALFPNASKHAIAANIGNGGEIKISRETAVHPAPGAAPPGSEIPATKPESGPRKRLPREVRGEVVDPGRSFVRVESRRLRLTDEDNLYAKPFVDSLRYAGAIHNDTPDAIKLEVFQTKVRTAEEEMTIIEIFPPGMWPEGVK